MNQKIFQTKIKISFSHVDGAGIMFFARAADLFHLVLEDFFTFRQAWGVYFQNSDYAFPLKSFYVDYFQPVKAGTELDVQVYLLEKQEKGFHLETAFLFQGKEVFRTSSVHICISKSSGRPCAIPSSIRALLEGPFLS